MSGQLTQQSMKELEPLPVSFFIQLPWADHDDWLKLPTTKNENLRTRNSGDFHMENN